MEERFYKRYESFKRSLDALAEARQRDMSDSFVLSGTTAKFSIAMDLAWKNIDGIQGRNVVDLIPAPVEVPASGDRNVDIASFSSGSLCPGTE